MSDRPIRLILDASAIVAFGRESLAVGEAIAEVDSDRAIVGVPLLCLVEASRAVVDADRLALLAHHHATVLLANDPERWRNFAAIHETIGRLDASSAAMAAYEEDCDVLTRRPDLYRGMAGGGPVIPF